MDMTIDVALALWRGVRVIVWVLFLPVRVVMWTAMMVTYLAITALVAGLAYGLWTSGVRPW